MGAAARPHKPERRPKPYQDQTGTIDESEPPRKLSSKPLDPDYRPDCLRVGVRFDGKERQDVIAYDADAGTIETLGKQTLVGVVEPYWRFAESRQQRRARERWEKKNGG